MDKRLFYSATYRNRQSIAEVLTNFIPKTGNILEIASGSGEHAVSFQKLFSTITWQASDPDAFCRESISAWISHSGLKAKMPEPLDIDVAKVPWPLSHDFCLSLRFIVCINMIHISPFSSTEALIENSSEILSKGALLFLYGPFKNNGRHTSMSNERFDQLLKDQNPCWGVRDLEEVTEIAEKNGLKRLEVIKMPANNLSVLFQKSF